MPGQGSHTAAEGELDSKALSPLLGLYTTVRCVFTCLHHLLAKLFNTWVPERGAKKTRCD